MATPEPVEEALNVFEEHLRQFENNILEKE
jgi:hypothetical protein